MLLISALLLSALQLSGCMSDSSDADFRTEPVIARETLETPGEYSFTATDWQVPNSSGKGEPTIPARSYAPEAISPVPLVIILPGFGASLDTYEAYAEHFASHGFSVVSVTFTGNDGFNLDGENDLLLIQVLDVIQYALGTLGEQIDEGKIAVMGHSQGGKMAFAAAASFNGDDPALPFVAVAVGLDPVNSGGAPCFISPINCIKYPVAPNPTNGDIGVLDSINGASLILRSEPDPLTNPEEQFNAQYFYEGYDGEGLHGAPSPALYYDMGFASHASYALPESDENPVPLIAKRTALAWFMTYLQSVTGLEIFLTGEYIQQDIDEGDVVSVSER